MLRIRGANEFSLPGLFRSIFVRIPSFSCEIVFLMDLFSIFCIPVRVVGIFCAILFFKLDHIREKFKTFSFAWATTKAQFCWQKKVFLVQFVIIIEQLGRIGVSWVNKMPIFYQEMRNPSKIKATRTRLQELTKFCFLKFCELFSIYIFLEYLWCVLYHLVQLVTYRWLDTE